MGQVLYFLSASVSDVPPPVRSPKYGSKKKVEKILEVAAPLTRRYPPSVQETMQASTIRPAAVGLLGMRMPRSSPARKAKFCLACSIKKNSNDHPCAPPCGLESLEEGVKGSTTLPRESCLGIYGRP